MTRIGDQDPITHGGGVVFLTNNGPFFEYSEGIGEGVGGDNTAEVFRTHIEHDVTDQFRLSYKDVVALCKTINTPVRIWLGQATGTCLLAKANCIVDIGNYLGWDAIDDDPLDIDEVTLQQRWYAEFHEEGPCAHGERPSLVVPELLKTLNNINPELFWHVMTLTKDHFPIVPAETVNNPDHPWWTQHGDQTLEKVVGLLEKVTPPGFTFEYRDGAFGFWRDPS